MGEAAFEGIEHEVSRPRSGNEEAFAVIGEFKLRPVASCFRTIEPLLVLFEVESREWRSVVLPNIVE